MSFVFQALAIFASLREKPYGHFRVTSLEPPLNDKIELNFSKGNGLLPAIVQDHQSGDVLMLAFINQASWERTLETGEAHYWSRSRQEIWHKGGTSGHVQIIKAVYADCDDDTVLFVVEQVGGAACHTGHRSCFHKKVDRDGSVTVVGRKVFDPEKVYKR
jgi:phosphoribosyl-AMP cyclohydrolase